MATVKWIKIVTDIFDDEKMLLIESLPGADSIIVIWFKLLCLAGKNNNSGVFLLNDRIPYTDEMLATIFRKDINTVRLALKTFSDFGMIELIDNVITIPNWSKHQTLDQMEERKEYMKNYMKKYRDKQKMLASGENEVNSKVNSKVYVNSLEEEREREEDKDKNKNRNINKKRKSEFDDLIDEYTSNNLFKNAIYDFIKMRKTSKAPMTSKALKLMLNKLDGLANTEVEKIEILNQSIMNCWKGVFPLKGEYNAGTNRNSKSEYDTGFNLADYNGEM